MNSAQGQSFADAFREHREAFGVPLQVGDDEITAVVNESPYGRDLEEGGFVAEGEVEARFLAEDVSADLKLGQSAIYKERPLRISRIASQPGALVVEVMLRPANR